jgi:uncharacterized protein YukE
MTAPAPLATINPYFSNQAAEESMLQVRDKIQEICDSLERMRPVVYDTLKSIFIASLGTASGFVATCWAAYEGVIALAPRLVEWWNDLNQWVWAPQNILDLATAMQPAYDKATECQQALLRGAMPADKLWEGVAVDAYYAHIAKHNAASVDVQACVKSMTDSLRDAGSQGVIATYVALGALVAALIDLVVGLIALIPPATPGGAAIFGLGVVAIGAIIAGLVAFAQAKVGVVTAMQSTLDGTLRSNNFPGGAWPTADSKALATEVESVGGWNY